MTIIKILNSGSIYTNENDTWYLDNIEIVNGTHISILDSFEELREEEEDVVIDLALNNSNMILLDSDNKEDEEIINAYSSEYGINSDLWDDFDLSEDDFIEVEDKGYIKKSELEEVGSINSYYDNTDIIDSTTTYYKFKDDYVVNPANDNNYYLWEDAESMINENSSEVEIWEQGNEELKKIVFGDDYESEIEDIVAEYNSPVTYRILKSVGLEDCGSPTHTFMYIGITEDKELIIFDVNNCNITSADRSNAEKFTVQELLNRNIEGIDDNKCENGYDSVFIPGDLDIKTIFDFWLENK